LSSEVAGGVIGTGGMFSESSTDFSAPPNRCQRRPAEVTETVPLLEDGRGMAGTDSWEILRERREARERVDGRRLPGAEPVGMIGLLSSAMMESWRESCPLEVSLFSDKEEAERSGSGTV